MLRVSVTGLRALKGFSTNSSVFAKRFQSSTAKPTVGFIGKKILLKKIHPTQYFNI